MAVYKVFKDKLKKKEVFQGPLDTLVNWVIVGHSTIYQCPKIYMKYSSLVCLFVSAERSWSLLHYIDVLCSNRSTLTRGEEGSVLKYQT